MEKFQRSQVAKILAVFLFLLILPFVSASMRPSYLYFLLNLLIVVLAIDSGLLGSFSNPSDEKKPVVSAPRHVATPLPNNNIINNNNHRLFGYTDSTEKPKMSADKPPVTAKVKTHKPKRSPSVPSLFFIGSDEEDDGPMIEDDQVMEEDEEEVVVEEVGDVGAQELFARAEMFIGNFYKQLRIQREESWKKIHGLYHKPF